MQSNLDQAPRDLRYPSLVTALSAMLFLNGAYQLYLLGKFLKLGEFDMELPAPLDENPARLTSRRSTSSVRPHGHRNPLRMEVTKMRHHSGRITLHPRRSRCNHKTRSSISLLSDHASDGESLNADLAFLILFCPKSVLKPLRVGKTHFLLAKPLVFEILIL
jgi:hypothetical protein